MTGEEAAGQAVGQGGQHGIALNDLVLAVDPDLSPHALQVADGGDGDALDGLFGLHEQVFFPDLPPGFQGLLHRLLKGLLLEGLEEEIDVLRLVDGGAVLHIPRDEDHLGLCGAGEELLGQKDAIVLAQQNIQNGDVRPEALPHGVLQVFGRGKRGYLHALPGKPFVEPPLQAAGDFSIVVAYHDTQHPASPLSP